MAIYDTMKYVKCDVSTICMGLAASMGSFLLAAGTKGKRYSLPHTDILIHQPSAGLQQSQVSDVMIHANYLDKKKKLMNRILSESTGQPLEVIERDTDRDNFMSPEEACAYGLIDKVITHR